MHTLDHTETFCMEIKEYIENAVDHNEEVRECTELGLFSVHIYFSAFLSVLLIIMRRSERARKRFRGRLYRDGVYERQALP